MNTSIKSVLENTLHDNALVAARALCKNANHRVRVQFVKKNGDLRTMVCIPRNNYNEVMGIETTVSGRKMVATKAKKDMVTVTEVVGDGVLRPRTINLRTIVGDIVRV